ncbi:hypothetical protein [Anoxynatronum sibiricum]|uniref:hypothetical protein n=1 Tax=Anoxynatronum sibiricum TaxID=210623 RepID=UPI0031B88CB0
MWGFRSLSANIQHQWYLCEEMEAPRPSEQQPLKAMKEKKLHFRYLMELQPDRVSILPIKDHQANLDEETFPLSNGLRSMTLLPLDGKRHMTQWGDDLEKTSVPVMEDFIASITSPQLAWVLVLRQAELMSPIDPIPRLLSAMGVGGRNGSIHLKPIEIDLKYIEVKTAYTQHVAFEYQKEQSSDEWQPVENQIKIDTSSFATIRMKFIEPSVIYDISITRLKEGLLEEIGATGRLDFHEAIDQEKSDVYKINEQRDYVEFSHKVVRDLLLEEPKVLAGAVTVNEDGTLTCTAEHVMKDRQYEDVTALWEIPVDLDSETMVCMQVEASGNWIPCLNLHQDKSVEEEFWSLLHISKRFGDESLNLIKSKRCYTQSYIIGEETWLDSIKNGVQLRVCQRGLQFSKNKEVPLELRNASLEIFEKWAGFVLQYFGNARFPIENWVVSSSKMKFAGINALTTKNNGSMQQEHMVIQKLSVIKLKGEIVFISCENIKGALKQEMESYRGYIASNKSKAIDIPVIEFGNSSNCAIKAKRGYRIFNVFKK